MELFRRQVVILITLFNAKEPVSGVVLSQKSGLSLNTLKKEIDEVNHSCEPYGFEILSKTGSGYEISIHDDTKFYAFRRKIQSRYYRNLFFRDSQTDRVHFIVRHMLSHDSLFVDDIADECFCSVSTINRDMRAVKLRLERRGLKLVNHTNRGMKVEGSEWNIRLALIDEYHIYRDFETTYDVPEDAFERLFLTDTTAREHIAESVRGTLEQYHYQVSYNTIADLENLFVVTVTRQKLAGGLKDYEDRFMRPGTEIETEIIRQIQARVSLIQQVSLSSLEIASLASYLHACRVMTHARLGYDPEKEQAYAYADGFLAYLESEMDLMEVDLRGLREDLACNLLTLKRKGDLNIHTSYSDVANFHRDGLISLDYCALLYLWLKDHTDIICSERDILTVYYVFSYFSKARDFHLRKRVLVVSRYGIYAARTLAYQFQKRTASSSNQIEYIPCEYLNIRHFDLGEIDCIATDIEELQNEFPEMPIVPVHFYRTAGQINDVARRMVIPREVFRREVFSPDDLIYTDKVRNEKELEQLIREKILMPGDDADAFMKEMHLKNSIYPPFRQNQLMLVNTLHDVLHRNFFKIIILEKIYKQEDQLVGAVVVCNAKDRQLRQLSYYSDLTASLLHADGLTFTMNAEEDYNMLADLMYGS